MSKKYLTQNLVKFLAVAVVCLLLVFLNPKGFFEPVRKIFLNAARPFQKTFYLLSGNIAGTFEFLGSIAELKAENGDLVRENNSLAAEISLLGDIRRENADLRQQLDLRPREKFDLEASFVIGQDPQRLGRWLMIDKGSSAGIRPGMPVIAYDSLLIGKVEEVTSDGARVILLSDSASAVNVIDLETSAKGILKGEYGLGIVMDMVTQTESLNQGDTVVTSGLGGDMPKGLLAGKVREVRSTGDKLFQQAIVAPRIKYSELSTVFVIKN